VKTDFPSAIPEIPVSDICVAVDYYCRNLGFDLDWGGDEEGGIAGISRGSCRLFLTNGSFRQVHGNAGPVLIWINLASCQDVDALHQSWTSSQARIISKPERKPWKLYEFTVVDTDGNSLRVFYDFAWEEQDSSSSQRQAF
jgi:predicted lactoylglutathione lyase